MKILLAHNYYREPGGEDLVFSQEQKLLRDRGHEVISFTRSNNDLPLSHFSGRLQTLKTMIWSKETGEDLRRILKESQPDIAHFHNTFHSISASAYRACAEAGVPVVQTLHNYRLFCPSSDFFRAGRPCEACLSTGNRLPSVIYGCYENSPLRTFAVACSARKHRLEGVRNRRVRAYIALTQFAKNKFVRGGMDASRIHVKSNFLAEDPGVSLDAEEGYALYIGRLTPEKGILSLIRAWTEAPASTKLKIVGAGPLLPTAQALTRQLGLADRVEFLGYCERPKVLNELRRASFLVFPSEWYEGFPMVLLESFACGKAVVASKVGGIPEIVQEGVNGLLFRAGDARDLAGKIRAMFADPHSRARYAKAGRRCFEERYGAETNYRRLMEIYSEALR